MTIPVNRVKLMAFAFGAMVAALAGTVFAAQQISVFPPDFNTAVPDPDLRRADPRRGGQHRRRGARRPDRRRHPDGLLRSPTDAGYIFYGLILVSLLVKLRPWRKLGAVLAATVALGFAAHAIAGAISASAVAGGPQSGGWIGSALRDWVIVPARPADRRQHRVRAAGVPADRAGPAARPVADVLLVPTIYLAACVWEARLAAEPSITRQILIGAILMVMMNVRPQGLLGTRRVEVIT